MIKRILLLLLGALLVAQLLQPDRTAPPVVPAQDMLTMTNAPADVAQLVRGACYDCHSNATTYPWYARITPVNFIMQDHIREGREVLNFSEWPRFAGSEAAGECGEEIQEGEMPPGYYRLMHAHGRLSDADKQKLAAWFNTNVPGGEGTAGSGTEEEHEEHE